MAKKKKSLALPNPLLDEIKEKGLSENLHKHPFLKRATESRKDRRKAARHEKKEKKLESQRHKEQQKSGVKRISSAPNLAGNKRSKVQHESQKGKNKKQKTDKPEAEISADESDSENAAELDDNLGVDDTWSALKAMKAKKNGTSMKTDLTKESQLKRSSKESQSKRSSMAESSSDSDEMEFGSDDSVLDEDFDDDVDDDEEQSQTVDETWAALKALKAKKMGKEMRNGESDKKSLKVADVSTSEEDDDEEEESDDFSHDSVGVDDDDIDSEDFDDDDDQIEEEVEDTVEDTWAKLKAMKESKKVKAMEPSSKNVTTKEKKRTPVLSEYEKNQLAQDEEDIEYYAKKLGSKKLAAENDGLDDLLGDLDFDLEMNATHESSDDTASEALAEDEEEEDEEGEDDEGDNKKRIKENPFVAPTTGSEANVTTPASTKYIPPSLRKKMAENGATEGGDSEQMIRLRRRAKGQLNKLTEANIGTILKEIEALYLDNARNDVTSAVTDAVLQSTVVQGTLMESFLIVHAALMTALYRRVGIEFGAYFVQNLVEQFDKYSKTGSDKEAHNLLSMLAQIYSFEMVSCSLLYDFIREFLSDITETNTEYLLRIVRNSGSQLRTDDPASLRDIILLLQSEVSKMDKSKINSRTNFLIETIVSLKNNRMKVASESMVASVTRMKKFLGTLGTLIREPIMVSLADIRDVGTKGKWWLVGSAWRGNSNSGDNTKDGEEIDKDAMNDILASAEPSWMDLARQQRMNTDIRRAIFVSVMSSEDYMDAVERISRLKLKNKQQRDVPLVLLHCCANEATYNPFYALVASKLCQKNSLRKSFEYMLWDFLGSVEDDGVTKDNATMLRKSMNYARFYAFLVSQGELTLELFRNVMFVSTNSLVRVFLELFFVTLFQALGKRAEQSNKGRASVPFKADKRERDETELIALVAKVKNENVIRGIAYCMEFVAKSQLTISEKQQERVKWATAVVADVTDELIKRM